MLKHADTLESRTLWPLAVLLALAVSFITMEGTSCEKRREVAAAQSAGIKAASGEIGHAARVIDDHADAIAKEAPQEKPHTDAIGEQTDALRVTQGKLDAAQAAVAINEKACAAKDGEIAARDGRIKALEDEKKNGMRQRLIQLVALGLIAAAVGVGLSVFLSAKIGGPVIAGGVALAVGAVEFQTVIDHAVWFTLGTVAIGGALLFTHGAAFRQVVGFAEKIKPVTEVEQIKQIGDQTQSWFTRVFVGWARRKLGVA
jgi:hypothetical protein